MQRKIVFTSTANGQLDELEADPEKAGTCRQVKTTLGLLEANPRHPGLATHEFTSLRGANGEKVFEAYAQNQTPGAYRVFWHYGPDEGSRKKRIPAITVIAITPHPA